MSPSDSEVLTTPDEIEWCEGQGDGGQDDCSISPRPDCQDGVGEALAARLQAQGDSCVLVQPGLTYQISETAPWQVNPTRPEDFWQSA